MQTLHTPLCSRSAVSLHPRLDIGCSQQGGLTARDVTRLLPMQVEDGDNLLQMLTEPDPASGPVTLLDIGRNNVATDQADFGSIFTTPMADGRYRPNPASTAVTYAD